MPLLELIIDRYGGAPPAVHRRRGHGGLGRSHRCTRTMPSAPSEPRLSYLSAVGPSGSTPGRTCALRPDAAVMTGEAAVTSRAPRTGARQRRPRQHGVSPTGRRCGREPSSSMRPLTARPPPEIDEPGRSGEHRTSAAGRPPSPAWRALHTLARMVRGRGRYTSSSSRHSWAAHARASAAQGHPPRSRRPESAAGPSRVEITGGSRGSTKSRLAWELEKYIDRASSMTSIWHQGRSPAYGEGIAFWALAEMVRQAARASPRAKPIEAAQAKLAARTRG